MPCVLVVDPDDAVRGWIVDALEAEQFDVLTARDCREAVSVLTAFRVDAIILGSNVAADDRLVLGSALNAWKRDAPTLELSKSATGRDAVAHVSSAEDSDAAALTAALRAALAGR